MARKGSQHRYDELKTEISALVKHFPHLAGRKGEQASRSAQSSSKRGKATVALATDETAPRQRRTMSATARKAISAAQKARWAKKRAGEKK